MRKCETCNKPMRANHGESIADHPGTVRAGSLGGQCASCRRRSSAVARKAARMADRPMELSVEQIAVRRLVANRCTATEQFAVMSMLGVA